MKHLISLFLAFILTAGPAFAGEPKPWQMNFQEAASPSMERITFFHDNLLILITVITIFVLALLAYVMFRFREKANPVPSNTTHHTLLEIIWTGIPVIILVFVSIPSIRILYKNDHIEKADMTLKVVGSQWFWTYEYPDNGNISFDSYIIKDADIKPGQIRLLEVDNRIVLPVETNIRLQTTAADVIHAWAMPALGVKIDAVPGKLNETWFRINKPGVYRGQCSEICGVYHGFMPIVIEAVSKEDFAKWVASKSPEKQAQAKDTKANKPAVAKAPAAQ